jgi:O-antigen/teichoic acid export membrane protein
MLKTVLKNTSYLLTHQAINKLLFTILIVFIARCLGPAALGEYAFTFVFEYILLLAVTLGSREYIVRELSRDKKLVPKVVGNITLINTVLMLLSLPPVLLASAALYPSRTHLLLRLIWVDAFLASYITIFTSIFRSYEKMQYEAVANIIHDLTVVVGSILLISRGFGILHVILMFIVGKSISFLYSSFIMLKHFPAPSFDADFRPYGRLIFKSIPFLVNGVFMLIIFRLDVLMIGLIRGETEVGLYESGYAIVRNLGLLSLVFVTALFPMLSRLHKADKTRLYKTYKRAFKYMLAVNIAVITLVILFSKIIVSILYGPPFMEAVGLMHLLVVGGLFLNMTTLNAYLLNAVKKEVKNVFFVGSAAALNVALNLALIPRLGYYGAAVATLITYLMLFIIQMTYITKKIAVNVKRDGKN